ncbi:MAG: nitrate reductase cytochrome c-type subunit [Elusimicrobia bacterium]|nr:nitrate reductase cytochrome c-type subunit [Elusimicrobiota bacterium]
MRKLPLTLALLAAALAAAAAGKVFSGQGLRTGAPGMNRWTDQAPGSTTVLPRPYPGAPPLIPHSIDGLAVTRATNDCLGCHLEGAELGEGHAATKVPASHYTNPYTKETKTGEVVGTRYNCLQCHAPQAVDAVPPVPQAPRG